MGHINLFNVPEEVQQHGKILAVEQDTTLKALIIRLIQEEWDRCHPKAL